MVEMQGQQVATNQAAQNQQIVAGVTVNNTVILKMNDIPQLSTVGELYFIFFLLFSYYFPTEMVGPNIFYCMDKISIIF